MSFPTLLERSTASLDELRRQCLAVLLRSPGISSLLARRDRRLAATLTLHAGLTLLLAIYVPVLLFVLGPIVLGVAHVAADVRYLVLRQKLAAWWQKSVLLACLALVALHALEAAHLVRASARFELPLVLAWVALGAVAGILESRAWLRAALAFALIALAGGAALRWPEAWRLVFVHLHNLVILAIWPLFYRARPRLLLFPLVLVAGGAALLATGFFYRTSLASFGGKQFGLHVLQIADWITPTLRADYAIGLTCAFVFLQGVHYFFWLNVIPQGELRGQGTLTFRMSARSLLADFGAAGMVLVAVAMLSVVVGAFVNAPRATMLYMSLVMFHGYLELVLLAYFWVARRPFHLQSAARAAGSA